jgi:hypothetical protein
MQNTVQEQSPLYHLHEILSLLSYGVHFMPANPETELDQLFISLDSDPQTEPPRFVLQLFFMEDILKRRHPELDPGKNTSSSLQMLLKLPLAFGSLNENQELEGLRLLILLNKMLPVGNWGLEGENKDVYYRYALMGDSQNFNGRLIIEIIELIAFFIQDMAPLLEAFVRSEKTALEILADSTFCQS